MKTRILLFSLLSILVLLGACTSSPVITRATGIPYEIVVVMDKANWDGIAGEAVKGELYSDIPGLPQSEPSFKITYVTPRDFNGLLTYVRNILIVNIDNTMYTKASLGKETNRWASGQVVTTLNAPDGESVAEYFENNSRSLVDFYTKTELQRAATLLEKTYSTTVLDNVKNRFGLSFKVPSDITYTKDAPDFFWASNNGNTGRMDILVYTFPYTDPETFTKEYLVAKRDSVLKANVPGSFPNSYMTTESRFGGVEYTPITLRGKYCGVMRGLWKMEGDMMGGPFVSHTRLDEENNRVVVVEGFVYAPETDKRNFIRRLEASLYTLQLPGDQHASVEDAIKNSKD